MTGPVQGCEYVAGILGTVNVDCTTECPFPFCVVSEAEIIKVELREHLARVMRNLGKSMEEIAEAISVSTRSVYRYTNKDAGCAWCSLTHSQAIVCRSNTYTVAQRNGVFIVVLNRHGHAEKNELGAIELFAGYVFPDSPMEKGAGDHDYWTLSRITLEEAKRFQSMCGALDRYTLSLAEREKVACARRR